MRRRTSNGSCAQPNWQLPTRQQKELPMFSRTDRPEKSAIEIPPGIRWGVGLAFGAALISGLAIYLNGFAVKQMADAAVFTTLKNAVAAIILITAAVGVGGTRG